jgi:superfamily II DNA or RNA helicase
MELRDYQIRAVEEVRKTIASGNKRVVMVLSTGGGKSLIFAEIIRLAKERGNRCLFLVHRRNLVMQMAETIRRHVGCSVGMIMAGHESDTSEDVQVGTIQTFSRRLNLDELSVNRWFFDAQVILVDECHTAVSKRTMDVLELYHSKVIIGCTATPMRADGRGLGEAFDSLVDVAGVKELTENGYLATVRYFAPTTPDLEKIKIVRGDYELSELSHRMNTPKLVGDIVENWTRIAPGQKSIVFCVNVKHAIAVCEAFNSFGIPSAVLTAKSSDDARESVFRDMENGRLLVICNVAMYIEGMDVPDISCVVMARPTKSLGLYRQACGRGLRPSPSKECLTVIDHGGVIEEHGLLCDEIDWSLDGKEKAWKKKKKKETEKKPCICQVCSQVFEGRDTCPDCGSPVKSFGKKIDVLAADLEEVGSKKKATMADKRRFYGMMLWYVRENKKNPKMVTARYKSKFGVWPRGMDFVQAIQPDAEFLGGIKHEQIKYAHRRDKQMAWNIQPARN